MNHLQIKKLRMQSLLKSAISEALAQLSDERLHELCVVDVICSRGCSDAKILLDSTFCEKHEEVIYLKQLKKAQQIIETYIKNDQGWYHSPKLIFEFDHQLENGQRIEELFERIRLDMNETNSKHKSAS